MSDDGNDLGGELYAIDNPEYGFSIPWDDGKRITIRELAKIVRAGMLTGCMEMGVIGNSVSIYYGYSSEFPAAKILVIHPEKAQTFLDAYQGMCLQYQTATAFDPGETDEILGQLYW